MNIVCILGSPRSYGVGAAIARQFLQTACSLGAELRTFHLNQLSYRSCQSCYACKTTLDRCVLADDLSEVLQAVHDADLVVLTSPVYFGDLTSQLKGFFDRTFSYLMPGYLSSAQPSRLPAGKKLLFILTQGHPDAGMFADIFPRYDAFLKWGGFGETRLIRACGVGEGGATDVPEGALQEAEEAARAFLAP